MAKKRTVTEERQDQVSQAANEVESAMNRMMSLYDDLDGIRANMEEKFSGTEKYQRLEELCGSVEEVKEALEGALENLNSLDVSYS